MRRPPMAQRCLIPMLVSLILPGLPGCLIPFGFPTISQTPLLSLGKEAEEIHAFRVDITREFVDIGGSDDCTLSEVTSSTAGRVFPQTRLSATYGMYVIGVELNFPVYTSHSVALKLYRPGYELVELDSWEPSKEIVWKMAPDLASQEKQLDRLFLMDNEEEESKWQLIKPRLSPGSKSAEHRRILLFGVSEYERLATAAAASGPQAEAVRRRLQSKAQKLKELADNSESPPKQ
jgi:hypothetical protein